MFSEYASKFLAQSQSRLSNFSQPNNERSSQQLPDRQPRGSRLGGGGGGGGGGRPFVGRGFGAGNPYQPGGSRFGHLLGSRYAAQDAPLFQATLEHEDEDEEERDREAADLYALQRSRRVFAASRLGESTETDPEGSRTSLDQSRERGRESGSSSEHSRVLGIKSSWNGARSFQRRGRDQGRLEEEEEEEEVEEEGQRGDSDETAGPSGKGHRGAGNGDGRMVDVGLESHTEDGIPPRDLTTEADASGNPPAFQKFHTPRGRARPGLRQDATFLDSERGFSPAPSSVDTNLNLAAGAQATPEDGEIFKHDSFFAWLYLIALASMLATFVLVFLHTLAPSGKKPWGDTVYTTLRSSFHLLAVDTLVAVIVSMVWLAALRSFVRPLVTLILVAVPVILVSFSLYPFVSSYEGRTGGRSLQDQVMRWAAILPGLAAAVWLYLCWKARHSIRKAVDILDFSSRILGANSALILVGMACLAAVVLWTWAWLAMFTRVFLGGGFSNRLARFVISTSTWWLGAYFVLMYLWTISIISGVQRGTTAATVSQWYFHRNVVPAPSSREIVSAALHHSGTTILGTVSLSALLALAVRLPLLVLPRRLAHILSVMAYSLVPTPISTLTNPLTLTYAAIHSQPLATSARGLSTMDFLSPQAPTTTLTPRSFSSGRGGAHSPLLPYRLAKLILHATRFVMSTALGFAGWVITARQLQISVPEGPGIRGSAYAYVVGLVASFIGWGILGAMEGILSGIVDAAVVCYGSEKRMASGGGGYCMEAAALFGGRADDHGRDEIY